MHFTCITGTTQLFISNILSRQLSHQGAVIVIPLNPFALGTVRLLFRLVMINSRVSSLKLFPDTHMYQVASCFRPIFCPLRHVEQSAKQTLEILRDMH